jgi:hypothetical protein
MIMATSVLGSILIGSTDPERLRSWYRAAFAPDQPEEGSLDVGGVLLVFNKRSDVADANVEPGRTIINLHVEDAREAVTRLNDVGVTWLAELERRPTVVTSRSSSSTETEAKTRTTEQTPMRVWPLEPSRPTQRLLRLILSRLNY